MTSRYFDINQHDALYSVARQYPGGVEALAQRMRKTTPVMYNKLRPGIQTHHVTFEEAAEIIELCQEAGIKDSMLAAEAFAWRLGAVLLPVPRTAATASEDLGQHVCKAVREFGDVASSIYSALATNNDINDRELQDFEKEFQEAIAAMFELRERVRTFSRKEPA